LRRLRRLKPWLSGDAGAVAGPTIQLRWRISSEAGRGSPAHGQATAAALKEAAAGWADDLEERHPGEHGADEDEGDGGSEKIFRHGVPLAGGHWPKRWVERRE